MIRVYLQNAYSATYAGREWPRESWLRALATSRSGRRLQTLVGDLPVRFENTTPQVGATPDSKLPPDLRHVAETLRYAEVVVACGKQAERVLIELWEGPLLVVPHPAHRLLTDALYARGHKLLRGSFDRRVALRQRRGAFDECAL